MHRLMRSATCAGHVPCRPWHHDRELFAAVAGAQVEDAHASPKQIGDVAQGPIALEVTEGVVDALEVVDVHHEEREVLLLAAGALDFGLNLRSRSTAG